MAPPQSHILLFLTDPQPSRPQFWTLETVHTTAAPTHNLHFPSAILKSLTSKNYFPEPELVALCEEYAKESGGSITLTEDVESGTKDVDVIYTDVWVSMGEPEEIWAERIKELLPYKVTKEVMDNAGESAIFLHCLPAYHDLETGVGREIKEKFGLDDIEVTDEVFESEKSKVFDEAENRMHTIKAVMVATLGER